MLSRQIDRASDETYALPAILTTNSYQYLPTFPSSLESNTRKLYSNLPMKCHQFKIPTGTTSNYLRVAITNCQYIGSYNWVSDHGNLSIIVPGSPRVWQEQQLPYTLSPDIQGHYREQYDLRTRSTPLLPLLLAVNYWHEHASLQPSKFPWHNVDFVTNRNSLRHLLRILRADSNSTGASGGSNGSGARRGKQYSRGNFNNPYSQPFRIDIELAGTKTILLCRWELNASEPLFANSYGFNFENAFTREADAVANLDDTGETARHHRINSYDFGGLQMVVRSEIDACLPFSDDNDEVTVNSRTSQTPSNSQPLSSNPLSTSFGLTIIPSPNTPTPQSHLIELSTTQASNFPTWNAKERYPQLYLSQVPNHYLASHTHGTITYIDKRNLHSSPEILFYAPTMEPNFKRLRELLGMIQSVVITQARRSRGTHKSFSLVYLHGQLSLYERVGERCLPGEAFTMFDV